MHTIDIILKYLCFLNVLYHLIKQAVKGLMLIRSQFR